jgi:hypothetical protein
MRLYFLDISSVVCFDRESVEGIAGRRGANRGEH